MQDLFDIQEADTLGSFTTKHDRVERRASKHVHLTGGCTHNFTGHFLTEKKR